MNTATGWSPGQRALLRFLQREGVLAEEPVAPGGAPATNAALFAHLAASIDQRGLVSLVADSLRVPAVDLDDEVLMQDLISLLTPEVAAACEMIPLAQADETLEVAAANPLDLDAVKTVEFLTGLRVRARVTTRASVLRALATWYGVAGDAEETATVLDAPGGDPEAAAEGAEPARVSIVAEPLVLPVASAEPETSAAVEAAPDAPAGDETPAAGEPAPARWMGPAGILVVSPALGVRLAARTALAAQPLDATVMTARDRAEAGAMLRAAQVHVLIVDAAETPEPDSQALAAEAPASVVLLGGPAVAPADPPSADGVERVAGLDTLAAAVRRILLDLRGERP